MDAIDSTTSTTRVAGERTHVPTPAEGHGIFLTHRARPGRRDDMVAVWEQHMRPLAERHVDHLAYFFCLDDADPDVVRVFQLYRDAEAAGRFLEQPAYADYVERVLPLVVGPPQLDATSLRWAKMTTAQREER